MAITSAQLSAALADLGISSTGLSELHIVGASNLLALGTTVTTVVTAGSPSVTTTTVWPVLIL